MAATTRKAPANGHATLANHHLAMQAHHLALSDHHESKGDKAAAKLHNGLAFHHLRAAEAHHGLSEAPPMATQTSAAAQPAAPAMPAAPMAPAKPAAAPAVDALAIGAATQLHRKGHIDTKTRDRIHAKARKPKSFGSMGGAGHYMGDVDSANSAGTNSGAS